MGEEVGEGFGEIGDIPARWRGQETGGVNGLSETELDRGDGSEDIGGCEIGPGGAWIDDEDDIAEGEVGEVPGGDESETVVDGEVFDLNGEVLLDGAAGLG